MYTIKGYELESKKLIGLPEWCEGKQYSDKDDAAKVAEDLARECSGCTHVVLQFGVFDENGVEIYTFCNREYVNMPSEFFDSNPQWEYFR